MEKAQEIFEKYKKGQCSPEELALLRQWFHNLGEGDPATLTDADLTESRQRFERHFSDLIHKNSIRSMWYRIGTAAAILLTTAAIGMYLYKAEVSVRSLASADVRDISPGGNKAILTLADGRKIILDSTVNGKLEEENGLKIIKTEDGQLVYELKSVKTGEGEPVQYNVIETPRGGQFKIVLPDGSRVWLNAASSLKYPVHFSDQERTVELKGEAFFDIATVLRSQTTEGTRPVSPDAQKISENTTGIKIPFLVTTSDQEVEVLGTQFNINAYEDEPRTTTTLLEGSVKVSQRSTNKSRTLIPGQQAVLSPVQLSILQVDTDEATAWKEGIFRFDDESLESIMRKISRWYDVDVEYENKALRGLTFNGIITHFSNVSKVLDMMERTNQVRFRLIGKKIIVYR